MTKACVLCTKRPSYGIRGSKRPEYCAPHKLRGMVNVINKFCLECKARPSFGTRGTKKATHCGAHKSHEMINVFLKTCLKCEKQPIFGIRGTKKATYCVTHKSSEMVNVKHKTCLDCENIPSFGIRDRKKATHCRAHKSPEMVNVINKTCLDCEKQPSFGIRGTKKATHCVSHKSPDMVDVINKTCFSEWCDTQVCNNKYKGFCLQCFVHLFPDNQIVRNYKTKERIVVDFVKTSFSEMSWTWDRRVVDGCSGARPDVICDLGDQLIIIEIDENHHGSYDSSCENKRLIKLSQDVAHRPIVVIRFNPDAYRTRDGVRHKSCFGFDGNGRVVVTEHVDWHHRLSCLKKTVQHWTTARTSKVLEVVPLFFTE